MNNSNLGFSVNAINKILNKEKWVEIYKNELISISTKIDSNKISAGSFSKIINPELQKTLAQESKIDKYLIRKTIAKWMQISHLKAFSLFKILPLISDQIKDSLNIYTKFQSIPIGPQEIEVVEKMDNKTCKRWRNGNLMIFFTEASISNTLGMFVSELFFTIESMLRVLCIGNCIEFAIKAIMPDYVIQHDEIHKTLKRLGKSDSDKVSCKICKLNSICSRNDQFSLIAQIYVLFYHLRAIKDYKREFYFNDSLSDFIICHYVHDGLDVLFEIDKFIKRTFNEFLMFPYNLSDIHSQIIKLSNRRAKK